jgi:hypothetical protein
VFRYNTFLVLPLAMSDTSDDAVEVLILREKEGITACG